MSSCCQQASEHFKLKPLKTCEPNQPVAHAAQGQNQVKRAENMKTSSVKTLSLFCAALAIAACSTGPKGVRISKDGTSATSATQGQTIRNYSAAEVSSAIAGKTFQYTRSDGNGFITYNADGSFEYQDDQKGAGKGRWTINGEQYCETFGAKAQECGIFKSTGDAFFAANSRLVEMKV
jgi:hypothetical protein